MNPQSLGPGASSRSTRPRLSARQARGGVLAGLVLGGSFGIAVLVVAWYVLSDFAVHPAFWVGDVLVVAVPVAALLAGWPLGLLVLRAHGVHRPVAVVSWALVVSAAATAIFVVVVTLLAYVGFLLSLVFTMSGQLFEPLGVGAVVVSVFGALGIAALVSWTLTRALRPRAAVPPGVTPPFAPVPTPPAPGAPGVRL